MRGPCAVSGLTLVALLALAGAAHAAVPELVVTAGGGYGGVFEPIGCLDGPSGCEKGRSSGSVLLGAGLFGVSHGGVRGALRLEGALAFGQGRGHHAGLLGVVGWQGEWLVVEGGLGSSMLWSVSEGGSTERGIGGVFHSGLGVRLNRSIAVLARADLIASARLTGTFLGLALEWLPLGRRP